MLSSKQPRKQRKLFFNAPLHKRKKFLRVRLAKELVQKLGKKIRNLLVRRGDKVKIIKGSHKGKSGAVLEVDYKKLCFFVEGITRRNAKGVEKPIPIKPSAVRLIERATPPSQSKSI
ncbi:MAG: 50S ribosomal protein L24 [Candidatus Anstonellaceae archaeon]